MQSAQPTHHCGNVPHFDRLNYHYGQMLGVRDFCTAHDYFQNKLKLINRCLHGFGVVCGLSVRSEVVDCSPALIIEPGVALDIYGNEIVIRQPSIIPLTELVCQDEFSVKDGTPSKFEDVYVTICFEERAIEPQQVDCNDTCRASNTMTYARKRDCPRICITKAKPPSIAEETCDPCCKPPAEGCLWLAKIVLEWDGKQFEVPKQVDASKKSIDNSVRRPVSLYRPTTITGINWVHGAWYSEDEAEQWLDEGLRIKFSRPILKQTIRDGIIDVWITNDWCGPGSGQFRSLACHLNPPDHNMDTDQLEVRIDCRGLQGDERILITLRTDFLLDKCGRAVDGNHIGGFVPLLPGSSASPDVLKQIIDPTEFMPQPAWGPWQSGTGTPGGSFISWFFINKLKSEKKKTY